MSHGPKVLKKRHTTSGPPSAPVAIPAAGAGEIPASNTTAALFAARVRFADPAKKEETKEERRRREKEEARRAKEREKAEKEQAKAKAKAKEREREDAGAGRGGGLLGAVFVRDHVKEAELAREREVAKASAAAKASGRKLSKRR